MSFTPTHEEQAFIRSYRSNVAVANLSELLYFLAHKEDAADIITEQIHTWSNIEDAWLMWCDAINYTKETTE
jgi:hypothetical protein